MPGNHHRTIQWRKIVGEQRIYMLICVRIQSLHAMGKALKLWSLLRVKS